MSVKRQATTELNRDNWDQEDEPEEMGNFKAAPKEELEKRIIKTAKRRSLTSGNEPKKSVFSGFGGFNKTQPSSFDFLANLTNGNKISTASDKNEISSSVSLLNNKPLATGSSGQFGLTATSTPTKPTFGLSTSQTPTLFGVIPTNTTASSVFTVSKSSLLELDNPFKIPAPSTGNIGTVSTFKNINSSDITTTPKMSSTIFGMTSEKNKTPNSTVFKIQQESGFSNAQSNLSTTKSEDTKSEDKEGSKCDNKKLQYYAKLKGLNESVSDWIKKHVDETPLCILTPIFKDYERYLKEMQDEYQGVDKNGDEKKENESSTNITTVKPESSVFSSTNPKPSIFGNSSSSSTASSTPGFSFGVFATTASTPSTVTSSPFSLATNTTTTTTNGGTGFTFGNSKPLAFGSNTQKPPEQQNNVNEEEDVPPKVEFTPVVEENSVYDKRCKIFAKKDGNFADKGVGTLYIKKIEENGKYQLLVRANTNLGTVLLNLILASAIPIQRMGKNNVMLVCIPTPDSKPPPLPILIRVKTSEEADELLETLNKYKT